MAQVTLTIGTPTHTGSTWVQWDERDTGFGDLSIFSEPPGESRALIRLRIFNDGRVQFQVTDVPDGTSGFASTEPLTDALIENNSFLTLQAAGVADFVIPGPDASQSSSQDTTEPYGWENNDDAGQLSWYNAYVAANRPALTIILDDGETTPQGTDHTLNPAAISAVAAISQPSVTKTTPQGTDHTLNPAAISAVAAISQPSVTKTTPQGTDHTLNPSDISAVAAISEPSLTRTAPAVADAGEDQSVAGDVRVTLDGSASTVGNGQIQSYRWTQLTGDPVQLFGHSTAMPYFTAPEVPQETKYSFSLRVRSTLGAVDTAYTAVTVAATNVREQSVGVALAKLERVELLIEQYQESTKFKQLINGLIAIVQDRIVDPLLVVERGLNPDESSGVILDWIGLRLDLPRPFVTSADAQFFGFDGTEPSGGRPWNQAPFWTPRAGIEQVEPVPDGIYRLLLKARARRLRGGADRETMEAVLDILFGNGYLDESATPMVLRVAVTDETAVLYALVAGRVHDKIIPRPAGRALTMAMV